MTSESPCSTYTSEQTGGAELYLRRIVSKYPEYTRLDEVLYQLAVLEYESERRRGGEGTLTELKTRFKYSPRAKEAEERLRMHKTGK
jgi:TolA-binding protein